MTLHDQKKNSLKKDFVDQTNKQERHKINIYSCHKLAESSGKCWKSNGSSYYPKASLIYLKYRLWLFQKYLADSFSSWFEYCQRTFWHYRVIFCGVPFEQCSDYYNGQSEHRKIQRQKERSHWEFKKKTWKRREMWENNGDENTVELRFLSYW